MVDYFWMFLITGVVFIITAAYKQIKNMNSLLDFPSSKKNDFFPSVLPVLFFVFLGFIDIVIGIILLVFYCIRN
jgi:hypothetical protein